MTRPKSKGSRRRKRGRSRGIMKFRLRRSVQFLPSSKLVPVRLRRIFAALDDEFPSPKAWVRDLVAQALDAFGKIIEKRTGVKEAIENLCSRGCNRDQLLWRLLPLCEQNSFDWLPGDFRRDPRRLKAITRSCRGLATQLREVKGLDFGPGFSAPLDVYFGLPPLLETAAAVLDALFVYFRPVKGDFRQLPLVWLVNHVYRSTGRKYCDKEVSRLIGATANGISYSADAHRTWRNDFYKRLMNSSPKFAPAIREEVEQCLMAAMKSDQAVSWIYYVPISNLKPSRSRHNSSSGDKTKGRMSQCQLGPK